MASAWTWGASGLEGGLGAQGGGVGSWVSRSSNPSTVLEWPLLFLQVYAVCLPPIPPRSPKVKTMRAWGGGLARGRWSCLAGSVTSEGSEAAHSPGRRLSLAHGRLDRTLM